MSKNSLRYASEAEMPTGMRALYQQRENGKNRLLSSLVATIGKGQPGANSAAKIARKKYGNHITHVDGIRFDSKREAKYYSNLLLLVAAGEILYFLRQVPIHLPGGTKLVVDFQIFAADGQVRYIDVKGRETPVFRLKKREVEHAYPHIRIELA
ncbi:MAG: DUF1064 domain-containing protein [Pseudoxanthomonas sp.]